MNTIKQFLEAYDAYQEVLSSNTTVTFFLIVSFAIFIAHDIYQIVKNGIMDFSEGEFITIAAKYFFLFIGLLVWIFSRSSIGGKAALFDVALENLRIMVNNYKG